jgi:hypothetical protein
LKGFWSSWFTSSKRSAHLSHKQSQRSN